MYRFYGIFIDFFGIMLYPSYLRVELLMFYIYPMQQFAIFKMCIRDRIETLATSVKNNDGVYLVPAFTGLGAPWWKPDAKAAIWGMTNSSIWL